MLPAERCTRETDDIAAELLRCGIASEALWRNMPLRSSAFLLTITLFFPHTSALPNISTSFPPKTLKMGTPKSETGWAKKFREIQVFFRISTETLSLGNSGKLILGSVLGGFSVGNENGQS